MSTYYDDASLVMIPSGVKEDKLYSIKPTDGSGDFTFSRGSDIQATRVNSSGLIEKAKVNGLTRSNDFGNAAWTKSGVTLTGGQSGYDGSSDAWLMTGSNASFCNIQNNNGIGSGVMTFSVYAKAGNTDYIALQPYGSGASYVKFDLSDGSVFAVPTTPIAYGIDDVGGGWYRCWVADTYTASFCTLYLLDSVGNFSNSATDSIYIQDSQTNHGLIAQDYVETTTTAVVEGLTADLPRLDYSGGASCSSLLLEPSRTNIVQSSEYLNSTYWSRQNAVVVDNATTSPEGVQNASKLYPDSSGNYRSIFKNFGSSLSSSASWSVTIFAKKDAFEHIYFFQLGSSAGSAGAQWFNLATGAVGTTGDGWSNANITPMQDGWYRCEAVFAAGGSNDYIYICPSDGDNDLGVTPDGTNGIFYYGAQIEAGSYPTSYIPTYGTAANRGNESASKTSATALIGQTQGTIFVEYDFDATRSNNGGSDNDIFHLRNSSGEHIKITHYGDGSGSAYKKVYLYQYRNSQNEVVISSSVQSTGRMKAAAVYRENYYALFLNGVKVGEDLNAGVPSLDLIYLNKNTGFVQVTNPRHQALVFKTALTDAECIALTTL